MPECIYHYFRDGVEIQHDEFQRLFDEDLDIEDTQCRELCGYSIKYIVLSDFGEGHDCTLNGHVYGCRCDYIYDSAKELLEDMIDEGYHGELFDAMKLLSEEDAKCLARKLSRVHVDGHKFILADPNDESGIWEGEV